jgi:hypothetical protein
LKSVYLDAPHLKEGFAMDLSGWLYDSIVPQSP